MPAPTSDLMSGSAGATKELTLDLVTQKRAESASAAHTAESIAKSVSEVLGALVGPVSENVADAVSEMVANAAHVVGKVVDNVVDALLGKVGGPNPVTEVLEQSAHIVADIARALGTLLFGGGNTGPIDDAMEQISASVATLTRDLAHVVGGALDMILSGRGGVPDMASSLVAQPHASHWNYGQIDEIAGRVGAAAGILARTIDEGPGVERDPVPGPAHGPSTPTPTPPPVPGTPPAGPAPAGYSTFLGASGISTDTFQQLLFIVAVLFVVLIQGGRLSWYRREPHRPHSALRLAVERPG